MKPPLSAAAALFLLWIAGGNLRITMLAVPPVMPLIHEDLRLSETAVGVLNTLPLLLFAVASVFGALLVARLGSRNTLLIGLVLVAAGSALRGAVLDTAFLFAMTFVMGIGIAVLQPTLPQLVRDWQPQRIALASAVYANGMLVWETISAAATIPWLLPLLDQSWRLSFVAWSALAVLNIVLVLLLVPPRAAPTAAEAAQPPRRWWPDWKNPLTWKGGLLFGSGASIYFTSNAFLPDFLQHTGRPELIGPALATLNVAQLPGAALLLLVAPWLVGRRWPFFVIGGGCMLAITVVTQADGIVLLAAIGVIGFLCAFVLGLSLALPPLLAGPDDVHRLSAGMFTITYPVTVLVPVLGGLAWDLTHRPAIVFATSFCAALAVIAVVSTIRFPGHTRT